MKFKMIIDPAKEEEVLVTAHARSELTDRIESLVMQNTAVGMVIAYAEDDMLMLPFDRIQCVTVIDEKTYAIDHNGHHLRLKMRLHELEKLLPEHFIRINKSAIANESCIERFTPSFSGAVDVVFKCGYSDYVSRRCFADIKRRYNL